MGKLARYNLLKDNRIAILRASIGNSLKLWLNSADSSTITELSDLISQWSGKSINGNNATQGTELDQPTLTASGIGGKQSVTFSGTSDHMSIADSASISLTGDCSFFFVINSADNADHQNILSKSGASGTDAYRLRITSSDEVYILINDGVDFEEEVSTGTITRDTDTLISVMVDIGNQVSFFINGVAAGTPSTSQASIEDTADPLLIGALTSSSEEFNGDIAEIAVYDRLLSAAQRKEVEADMMYDWGIAI